MPSNKPKIGLLYNLAVDFPETLNYSGDLQLEWDSLETILDIKQGLKANGYEVCDIGNPKKLLDTSVRSSIDIVFSICEMQGIRYRESIVPSLCEFLELPYSFSSPDTMMITLDKNICNLLLHQISVTIPDSFIVKDFESLPNISFDKFPYFLKPSCEGSSIGISEKSIVYDESELRRHIKLLINTYKQPILVQEYLKGDDITVGVIENSNKIEVLTPLIGKIGKKVQPVNVQTELFEEITKTAKKIFKYLNCRDVARLDFKLGENSKLFFLEINPLPHFSKRRGYLAESAIHSNFTYENILNIIILNTIRRFNLH